MAHPGSVASQFRALARDLGSVSAWLPSPHARLRPRVARSVAIAVAGIAVAVTFIALPVRLTPEHVGPPIDQGATRAEGPSSSVAGLQTATDPFAAILRGPAGLEPLDVLAKGVLVGGLLYLTLRVLTRLQSNGVSARRELIVLESRTLAPKASVHLVAVGDRRILVGLTQGGIAALADLGTDGLASRPEPATRMGGR